MMKQPKKNPMDVLVWFIIMVGLYNIAELFANKIG